jgi:hypothetical protein
MWYSNVLIELFQNDGQSAYPKEESNLWRIFLCNYYFFYIEMLFGTANLQLFQLVLQDI